MQVTAHKFHRNIARYLRMVRGGEVKEIRVTWHGIPAVRIESVSPWRNRRSKK